jgi:hypothetical protein
MRRGCRYFTKEICFQILKKMIDLDFYEHCVYGKDKRFRLLRVGKEKKSERLEIVKTYVWGPTQVSSLGGSHYYVTFIDDAIRKT